MSFLTYFIIEGFFVVAHNQLKGRIVFMYLIYSSITKSLYIDEKRQAAAFLDIKDAEKYRDANENVYIYADERTKKDIYSDCYAAGALSVNIANREGKEKFISLREDLLERRFYNGKANADIARYAHTKDPACVLSMGKDRFIVPVKITNHPYVKVMYLTAFEKKGRTEDGRNYFYLAFTDLKEYEKWGKGKDEWSPLIVDFKSLARIGKNHGFIINLMGTKFLLNKKKFEMVEREEL